MNLIIDIGNSRTKAAINSGGEITGRWTFGDFGPTELEMILAEYPGASKSILSSTRNEPAAAKELLSGRIPYVLQLGPDTPLPITNLYRTPLTLGADRIAAAVGAAELFPHRNIMIVDFGTAITIDFVTATGEYLGGNISAGASLRLHALHKYTGKLPLVDFPETADIIGGTTEEALQAGMADGIIFEIEGYMRRYGEKFDGLTTIFTGGEGKFFEKQFKNTIFADYDLVVTGLNRILEYNANS